MNVAGHKDVSGGRMCLILFLFFIGGMLLSMVATAVITVISGGMTIGTLQSAVAVQNVCAFVLPVWVTLLLLRLQPMKFTGLGRLPSAIGVTGCILLYIVMTPAMNWLVAWNEQLTLPEALAPLEKWLKESEAAAQQATDLLMSGKSVVVMLCSVAMVGVLTGFSEELFFRGGLQNIFSRMSRNKHIAVWGAALVFSALHFQFYGFVPRLLLGVFFGYMLLWGGSLWLPIIGHVLNNSMVVIFTYLDRYGGYSKDLSTIGCTDGFPLLALLSCILTVGGMIALHRYFQYKSYGTAAD